MTIVEKKELFTTTFVEMNMVVSIAGGAQFIYSDVRMEAVELSYGAVKLTFKNN